ncbi:tetratricopeptide repeat protein [Roseiconus lacunae]|uniref:protein O-GlcNAc transferase n=1 Tax=Roseiconus lacunae TaxID=2605694 RepID=A0ABT7PE86_9BACT|nr:tetratricopeptide repeat protein [Roseiconus lacunae]MDM4014812.1 tetratricopeptide repeat protein [Roseiconus lacunae]
MTSRKPLHKRKRRTRSTAGKSLSSTSNESGSDATGRQMTLALDLQRKGKLDGAKQIYCQIISQDPTHSEAWHWLGMTLYSGGAHDDAVACLEKARSFSAKPDELLPHLAIVYHGTGKTSEAIDVLRIAISKDPNNAELHNNLGVFYLETEQYPDARTEFDITLKLQPDFAQASMNLGNCLVKLNQLHDAERLYRSLLQQDGNHLDVMGNLGECLRRQRRYEDALEYLQPVIDSRPQDLNSRLTHARTIASLGRLQRAKELLTNLCGEFPSSELALHYLGSTLHDLGDFVEANVILRRALQRAPNDARIHASLGAVLLDLEQRGEALECFRRAIELDPTLSGAHGCLLYLLTGTPDVSPEEVYQAHLQWGNLHGSKRVISTHRNQRTAIRPLRIGYASADFREHAVAGFFEPLLRLRDAEWFETFCYYEGAIEDDWTRRLKNQSDHWRVTFGYSDDQIVAQVIEDKIDILVDLSGHTVGNRLTAWSQKPAPVQISWLGYPNTTGLDTIDYSFTCEVQNPIDESDRHSETLIRIPGGSFSFQAPPTAPKVSELPAKTRRQVTFGSLHRPFKISASTHDYWATALQACPEARLLAFHTRFTERSASELRSALEQQGIDPARIEIRNQFKGDSYLEIYREIDLALDVTPWAGGTTTMEALWMGIPMIAIYGSSRPSRGTAGIVHHLGHPEWIAKSKQEYRDKTIALAEDIEQLAETRHTLREKVKSTIGNEARFVNEIEKAYRRVWINWCRNPTVMPSLRTPTSVMTNSNPPV